MVSEPLHPGELRVQAEAGERVQAKLNGRVIGDSIMAPAFDFLARLPVFVLARAGADNACDLTVLFGAPGFVRSSADGKQLLIALDPARDRENDPVLRNLAPGQRIGGLAIDLETRRRLRINGRIAALAPERLELAVAESFPNCPKHIQKRELVRIDQAGQPAVGASGRELGDEQRAIIRGADTFFVASVDPEGHADASHRGGAPGFVEIVDGELRVPDYAGNSMFNTLGNFAAHDHAALLVWDFERNVLLHLRGRARLSFGEPDEQGRSGGTGRFWYFRPERWVSQGLALPFRLQLRERSKFNPML